MGRLSLGDGESGMNSPITVRFRHWPPHLNIDQTSSVGNGTKGSFSSLRLSFLQLSSYGTVKDPIDLDFQKRYFGGI
jgi:hypothetical protein